MNYNEAGLLIQILEHFLLLSSQIFILEFFCKILKFSENPELSLKIKNSLKRRTKVS